MSAAPLASVQPPQVALACGGTGGHLYPGLAIADALRDRGCEVLLLISRKEVDQRAVCGLADFEVETLPAVALQRGQFRAFLAGFWDSYRTARTRFLNRTPAAVVSMGGFTSVAPVLAGRRRGAVTFLHEANAVPGRANRWLARVVDEAFVYFPEAGDRLRHRRLTVTGMPVRAAFQPADAPACRLALGLDPQRPVLLVVGGSQGAHGLNEALLRALPSLVLAEPQLQFIHLTGTADLEPVRRAHAVHRQPALVRPFLTEMELALGAATLTLSRAGASALAELAAMRVPAILVPFPAAADHHQAVNARAFARSGAAAVLLEHQATPDRLLWQLRELLQNQPAREALRAALAKWHQPNAAERIADAVVARLPIRPPAKEANPSPSAKPAVLALRPAGIKPHA